MKELAGGLARLPRLYLAQIARRDREGVRGSPESDSVVKPCLPQECSKYRVFSQSFLPLWVVLLATSHHTTVLGPAQAVKP